MHFVIRTYDLFEYTTTKFKTPAGQPCIRILIMRTSLWGEGRHVCADNFLYLPNYIYLPPNNANANGMNYLLQFPGQQSRGLLPRNSFQKWNTFWTDEFDPINDDRFRNIGGHLKFRLNAKCKFSYSKKKSTTLEQRRIHRIFKPVPSGHWINVSPCLVLLDIYELLFSHVVKQNVLY